MSPEALRNFQQATSEAPPEYARTRMAKRHATLRDDTRLPGGAVLRWYQHSAAVRRCIANATVHCTSSLERAFGVSSERRANYNVARMLNAVPFPRSIGGIGDRASELASERRFRAILRFGSYVMCLSGVLIAGGASEGENSCAFSIARCYRAAIGIPSSIRSPLPFLLRFSS